VDTELLASLQRWNRVQSEVMFSYWHDAKLQVFSSIVLILLTFFDREILCSFPTISNLHCSSQPMETFPILLLIWNTTVVSYVRMVCLCYRCSGGRNRVSGDEVSLMKLNVHSKCLTFREFVSHQKPGEFQNSSRIVSWKPPLSSSLPPVTRIETRTFSGFQKS